MAPVNLGFIGVGRMGAPMAKRLIDAGHKLTVFDISAAARDELSAYGAEAVDSPAAVASRTETVLMSLPTPDVVHTVAFRDDGLTSGDKLRVVVDLSTTGPRGAAELAEGLAEKGIRAVDCPVSGGVAGARKGTLALMAACERAQFEELESILKNLGKPFFVGEKPGMAQMMKVINNLMSVTALAISSEALTLGVKAGLDPDVMIDVINAGSGRNSATADKIPNFVLPRTFDFGFALALSAKDLKLCLDEGNALGVPMIVGSAVRQLLTITRAKFGAEADLTTLIKPVEEWAGVEVTGAAAKK